MYPRKFMSISAIATIAVIGLGLPGEAQDVPDHMIKTDVQVSLDDDLLSVAVSEDLLEQSLEAARRELELKRKALDQRRAAIQREMHESNQVGDRHQYELALAQLELQQQQLELQRTAMEHARMDPVHRPSPTSQDQIRDATRKLRTADDDATRAEVIDRIEALLNKYFDEDIERRQAELDKVAERLEKLRAQVDLRLQKKQEIVDLQLKVILNEANGLGFFGMSPEHPDPFFATGDFGRQRAHEYDALLEVPPSEGPDRAPVENRSTVIPDTAPTAPRRPTRPARPASTEPPPRSTGESHR